VDDKINKNNQYNELLGTFKTFHFFSAEGNTEDFTSLPGIIWKKHM
jgi:hypothetical protein